jgi:hypothetical protein
MRKTRIWIVSALFLVFAANTAHSPCSLDAYGRLRVPVGS